MSKPNRVTIRPALPESVIRFPEQPTRRLAVDGESVRLSAYWRALIADGSVVEVKTATKKGSK